MLRWRFGRVTLKKIIQKFKRGAYRAFCLNSAMSAPSWWISMPFLAIFGVVLDGLLGEPRRAYPVHCVLLWFALGARSLYAHILPIQRALQARQLDAARRLTAHIVSRETS